MTEEQELLELMRGQIASLPGDQPELVNKIAVGVRELIRRYEAYALLAIALVRVHPLVRSDGLFRCAVCHGTKIMQGQSLEHRKPCGKCKGEGYLPPPPYRSTSTYPWR